MEQEEEETAFLKLSDDLVLNIFFKLEDDPRHFSRLASVCTKFSSLIRNVCWKTKCSQNFPLLISDLTAGSSLPPPDGWASLYKLGVCCPGLHLSGVLLESSDFGLERELGPDENYLIHNKPTEEEGGEEVDRTMIPSSSPMESHNNNNNVESAIPEPEPDCSWSLYDDLYFDTLYDPSEYQEQSGMEEDQPEIDATEITVGCEVPACKKRRVCRSLMAHLASSYWNLCREQGNKLLASRFRGDCLYICDWPGCIHMEEKRNYMLFRGIFKDFKRSTVWRTINDGKRDTIDLNCAFCPCKQTWDLHSAFCLKRVFGFHDDGEPVVRAYVCENGHVSGAWTDWPLYT
ncbi:phytochrome A-associated F-box protein [Impatiens glandulifera]|uniref:phytochrome A-associated F-box protein n=1 Tax=Impatiens glandulifera TaxID=253017 RepID=UPI001FB06CBE|nr:phytochrome A-associated F-box protein [Impatiens glandulifera]